MKDIKEDPKRGLPCWDVTVSKTEWIPGNPNQIPPGTWKAKLRRVTLKLVWEKKHRRRAKKVLKKINDGRLLLLDVKTYFKVTKIKIVSYGTEIDK